jgi:hypothetical protein
VPVSRVYNGDSQSTCEAGMATETTGWAIEQILNAAMGFQMSTAMWEGACAGNVHWPMRSAVVC